MSLYDDVLEAIIKIWDSEPTPPGVAQAVWAVLEDKIGSAQEALFNQLTMVRTELDASRRREAEMRVTIAALTPAAQTTEDDE